VVGLLQRVASLASRSALRWGGTGYRKSGWQQIVSVTIPIATGFLKARLRGVGNQVMPLQKPTRMSATLIPLTFSV
jgi:hypothetical protein